MILRGNSDDLGRTGRGLLVNKGFGFCRIFGPAVFVFLRSPMRRGLKPKIDYSYQKGVMMKTITGTKSLFVRF